MKNVIISNLGKAISFLSRLTNQGSGATWPGHIALGVEKDYIKKILKNSPTQIVLIAGTNGKTTTGKILTTILEKNQSSKQGDKVFQNSSGANLLNGIASSLLLHTNIFGKLTTDYAIFEVDENNLPLVLEEVTPKAIIVLDLFRDQLDRYGELDNIAGNWKKAFDKLPPTTQLILNADDPLIAYLGRQTNAQVSYFGLDKTGEKDIVHEHAADSLYCPRCGTKLTFQKTFYSHLGIWKCPHCKLQRPLPNLSNSYFPLEGMYNKYNTLAAVLAAQVLGVHSENIQQALHDVTPAFGRQESVLVHGKKVQLFLSKNPTSFNESLKTIREKRAKYVAFILNDRIPDGRDVSWIWDIDLEEHLDSFEKIIISGDRTYDMALRLQYANEAFQISNVKLQIEPNLKLALQTALDQTPNNETLYMLPTYSAMLQVRKILTGRKIL